MTHPPSDAPGRAPRVGLIGPERRRSGTGPQVAHFLHEAGAIVCATAASSLATASAAAAALQHRFGHRVRAYPDSATMMEHGELDAVAICSPREAHAHDLRRALRWGLHTLCEKPLVWSDDLGELHSLCDLVHSFAAAGLVLHENAQWPFLVSQMPDLVGAPILTGTAALTIELSPATTGPAMFPESGPHVISIAAALGATQLVSLPSIRWRGADVLDMDFEAVRSPGDEFSVHATLAWKAAPPRPAILSFDGRRVDRVVLGVEPFRLALRSGSHTVEVEDPMRQSVRAFVERVSTGAPGGAAGAESADLAARLTMLAELWAHVRAGADGADFGPGPDA